VKTNTSDQGRIGIAGVYTTPAAADENPYHRRNNRWVIRGGKHVDAFPPEVDELSGEGEPMPAFPGAVEAGVPA